MFYRKLGEVSPKLLIISLDSGIYYRKSYFRSQWTDFDDLKTDSYVIEVDLQLLLNTFFTRTTPSASNVTLFEKK